MSLRDAVSAANLSSYAEVALVIFMVVFAVVALELLLSGKRHEAARSLPLDQENTALPRLPEHDHDHPRR